MTGPSPAHRWWSHPMPSCRRRRFRALLPLPRSPPSLLAAARACGSRSAAAGVVLVIGGIVGLNLLVAESIPNRKRRRRPSIRRMSERMSCRSDRARRHAAGRSGGLHLDEPEPRSTATRTSGRRWSSPARSLAADTGPDRGGHRRCGHRLHRRDAATRRRSCVRDRAGVRRVSGEGGVTVEFAGEYSPSVRADGSSSGARATSNWMTTCS